MLDAHPNADLIAQRDGYPNGAGFDSRGLKLGEIHPNLQMTGVVNVGFMLVRSTPTTRELFATLANIDTLNDQHLLNRLLNRRGVRFEAKEAHPIPYGNETIQNTDAGPLRVVLLSMTSIRRCDTDACELCADESHQCCDTTSPFSPTMLATTAMRTLHSPLSVPGTLVFHCMVPRTHDQRVNLVKDFGLWALRDDWMNSSNLALGSFSAWMATISRGRPHFRGDGTGRLIAATHDHGGGRHTMLSG